MRLKGIASASTGLYAAISESSRNHTEPTNVENEGQTLAPQRTNNYYINFPFILSDSKFSGMLI